MIPCGNCRHARQDLDSNKQLRLYCFLNPPSVSSFAMPMAQGVGVATITARPEVNASHSCQYGALKLAS